MHPIGEMYAAWFARRLAVYAGIAIVCVLLAFTFGFWAARAQEGCAPLAHVLKTIGEAIPITRTVRLDAEQTANVVIWWNEHPPESNDAWNMAVVIAHPNGRLGLLVGNDGNICATLGLKPDMIESFVEAIAGKPPKAGSI